MFCGKCGTNVPDGVPFCPNCGEKLIENENAPVAQQNPAPQEPAFNPEFQAPQNTESKSPVGNISDKLKAKGIPPVVIPIIAAVIVIILIIIIASGGSSGYEKAVKNYYGAINDRDAEQLVETYADFYVEYYNEINTDDFAESCQEKIEDADDNDLEIEYEIKKVKVIKKDSLDDLREDLYEYYGEEITDDEDKFEKAITDAALITVKGKYKFENEDGDDDDKSFKDEYLFVKENGKWKYAPFYADEDYFETK